MSMGWGRFDDDRIHAPSNDALTVGFALAHQEFLQRQRFALSWNQLSADHISIELKPNQQAMTAPLSINHLAWLSSNDEDSATSRQHAVEIDHRGSTLYAGEARSFFLPVAVLQRLVCGLRGRPAVVDREASLSLTVQSRNRTCFGQSSTLRLRLTIAPIVPSISNEPQIGRATSPNASHSEGSDASKFSRVSSTTMRPQFFRSSHISLRWSLEPC